MHRLGFTEGEISQICEIVLQNPALRVASVFSHLSASDIEKFDQFTQDQIASYKNMCSNMEQKLGYGFLRHIANSAAVNRFPESHFDMVRLGIGLYGVDGSGGLQGQLKNVTTFKSVISQIKEISAGESVGYNRAALLKRKTQLAIIPVGYADGLDRRLGNGQAHLLVNGQMAPTLGNISMDMCTIDVTGLNVAEGDEVIIFGEKIPVTKMAEKLSTIPYEIYTSIPPRVKRVYLSE
jgi:Alr-MurF fusion protein